MSCVGVQSDAQHVKRALKDGVRLVLLLRAVRRFLVQPTRLVQVIEQIQESAGV